MDRCPLTLLAVGLPPNVLGSRNKSFANYVHLEYEALGDLFKLHHLTVILCDYEVLEFNGIMNAVSIPFIETSAWVTLHLCC